jgi:hypothetical protein
MSNKIKIPPPIHSAGVASKDSTIEVTADCGGGGDTRAGERSTAAATVGPPQ